MDFIDEIIQENYGDYVFGTPDYPFIRKKVMTFAAYMLDLEKSTREKVRQQTLTEVLEKIKEIKANWEGSLKPHAMNLAMEEFKDWLTKQLDNAT